MNTIANFCVREFSSLAFTISSPSLCVNAVCYYEWLFSILKNIILFRFFFFFLFLITGKAKLIVHILLLLNCFWARARFYLRSDAPLFLSFSVFLKGKHTANKITKIS